MTARRARWRARCCSAIAACSPPPSSNALRRAGLMHLVAISGMHVGILIGAALALAARARVGPPARFLLAAIALAAFVPLVGARSSVERAAMAAGILLFGGDRPGGECPQPARRARRRHPAAAPRRSRRDRLPPDLSRHRGNPALGRTDRTRAAPSALPGLRARRRPRRTRRHRAGPPLSPSADWRRSASSPACSAFRSAPPFSSSGYASLAASLLWEPAARALAAVTELAAEGLLGLAQLVAAFPMGSWVVPVPDAGAIAASYLLLGLARCRPARLRRVVHALTGVVVALIHFGPPPERAGPPRRCCSTWGRGSRSRCERRVGRYSSTRAAATLRDSTPASGSSSPFPRVGVRRVEVVAATHDHLDHVGRALRRAAGPRRGRAVARAAPFRERAALGARRTRAAPGHPGVDRRERHLAEDRRDAGRDPRTRPCRQTGRPERRLARAPYRHPRTPSAHAGRHRHLRRSSPSFPSRPAWGRGPGASASTAAATRPARVSWRRSAPTSRWWRRAGRTPSAILIRKRSSESATAAPACYAPTGTAGSTSPPTTVGSGSCGPSTDADRHGHEAQDEDHQSSRATSRRLRPEGLGGLDQRRMAISPSRAGSRSRPDRPEASRGGSLARSPSRADRSGPVAKAPGACAMRSRRRRGPRRAAPRGRG